MMGPGGRVWLSRGRDGVLVEWLRSELQTRGMQVVTSAVFDEQLFKAVQAAQGLHGLPQTGLVDEATLDAVGLGRIPPLAIRAVDFCASAVGLGYADVKEQSKDVSWGLLGWSLRRGWVKGVVGRMTEKDVDRCLGSDAGPRLRDLLGLDAVRGSFLFRSVPAWSSRLRSLGGQAVCQDAQRDEAMAVWHRISSQGAGAELSEVAWALLLLLFVQGRRSSVLGRSFRLSSGPEEAITSCCRALHLPPGDFLTCLSTGKLVWAGRETSLVASGLRHDVRCGPQG